MARPGEAEAHKVIFASRPTKKMVVDLAMRLNTEQLEGATDTFHHQGPRLWGFWVAGLNARKQASARKNPKLGKHADMFGGETCAHCQDNVDPETMTNVHADGDDEQWCEKCSDDGACACEGGCDQTVPCEDTHEVKTDRRRSKTWCNACIARGAGSCENCNELYVSDALQGVWQDESRNDSQSWCDDCVNGNSFNCQSCNETYTDSVSSNEVEGDTWCERCTERHANWCERHEQHFRGECGDCEDDPEPNEDDDLIAGYHAAKKRGFRPIDSPWVKAQPKPLYFGCELEVEVPSGKNMAPYAQAVKDSMGELLAGMEHDGSLTHGFEIVSQPAGLDTHREIWSQVKLKGLKSHDTSTCGLHVHVTRGALSKLTLGKMIEFTYADANRLFMEQFARRSFTHYAKRIAGLKIAKAVKERPERYEAWNTQNTKTVEFRLPRGTTKVTTILATLEFVYALIRFCGLHASASALTIEKFKHMVSSNRWLMETRFLRAYLVDRGLASPKEMRLPKIRAGAPPAEDAAPHELNPSEPRSYAEAALREYREVGEGPPAGTV